MTNFLRDYSWVMFGNHNPKPLKPSTSDYRRLRDQVFDIETYMFSLNDRINDQDKMISHLLNEIDNLKTSNSAIKDQS